MLEVTKIPSAQLIESAADELKAANDVTLAAMGLEFEAAVPRLDDVTVLHCFLLGYYTALVQAALDGGPSGH